MSEYKDGRGDYYLAEGKREERADSPSPEGAEPLMPPQHCECGRELPCYDHKSSEGAEPRQSIDDAMQYALAYMNDPEGLAERREEWRDRLREALHLFRREAALPEPPWLGEMIEHWRKERDNGNPIAEFYVDALLSVRHNLEHEREATLPEPEGRDRLEAALRPVVDRHSTDDVPQCQDGTHHVLELARNVIEARPAKGMCPHCGQFAPCTERRIAVAFVEVMDVARAALGDG